MLAFFAERKHSVLISRAALQNPLYYGEAHFAEQRIVINPHRGNLMKVLETLVHEAIHLLWPDWTHHSVNRFEREVMGMLTSTERHWIFYRGMQEAVWKDE